MKKAIAMAVAVVVGLALGGCDFWSQASGSKDPSQPDVLNGEGIVVVNTGSSNDINVGDRDESSGEK